MTDPTRAGDAQPMLACANCLRPQCEHNGKLCPRPFTTHWHPWDYRHAQPSFAEYASPVTAAAQPSADVATQLTNLIDRYWELAHAEGNEGRDHDTPDGDAQRTRWEISHLIRQLVAGVSPSPAEPLPGQPLPATEPCPCGEDRPEKSCTNRHQCWEPCGELGKSEEHVRVGRETLPGQTLPARMPGFDGRGERFCRWQDDFTASHGGLRPAIGDAFDAAFRMAWTEFSASPPPSAPAQPAQSLTDEQIDAIALRHPFVNVNREGRFTAVDKTSLRAIVREAIALVKEG